MRQVKVVLAVSLSPALFMTSVTGCASATTSKQEYTSGQPIITGSPAATSGTVVPPVPVIGSYLNSQILEKDGTPIAHAMVVLFEGGQERSEAVPTIEESNKRVMHETKTDADGKFTAPVEKINSTKINVSIKTHERSILSELVLPLDLAIGLSFARVKENLPPLEGVDITPLNSINVIDERKLVLEIPENRFGQLDAGTLAEPTKERVVLVASSASALTMFLTEVKGREAALTRMW